VRIRRNQPAETRPAGPLAENRGALANCSWEKHPAAILTWLIHVEQRHAGNLRYRTRNARLWSYRQSVAAFS
jgi:hypothetical protein